MGKRNRSGVWKVRWFVLKDKLLQYYKVRTNMDVPALSLG